MRLIEGLDVPPFARLVWASLDAQSTHEAALQRAVQAYHDLELLTVQHGVRRCLTRHFSPERLVEGMGDLAARGLVFIPLRQVGAYSGFAHRHPPVVGGQPWTYYGVIARSLGDAEAFQRATVSGDHKAMGRLLGYPECCVDFFDEVWRQKGFVDPIWQAALRAVEAGQGEVVDGCTLRLTGYSPLVLSVLRYVGLRLTANIPCSPACVHSHQMAERWLDLGRSLGVLGVEELLGFLSMPIQWDCLHGVAEVRTPIFKVVTNSMPTAERYRVNFVGFGMPEQASRGLEFPYNNLRTRKGLQRSLRSFEEAVNGQLG